MKQIRSICIVFALLLSSCAAKITPQEESAVAQAGIQAAVGSDYTRLVILAETDSGLSGASESVYRTDLLAALPDLPDDLLDSYFARNAQPAQLMDFLDLPVEVVALTQAELSALYNSENMWNTFPTIYPGAPGILTLSRAGFNRAGDQALLYVGLANGSLSGQGLIYWMVKQDGAWSVKDQVVIWIS
jgi:hypothetical protein